MFVYVPFLQDEVVHRRIRVQPNKPHAVVRLFDSAPTRRFRRCLGNQPRSILYSNLVQFGRVSDGLFLIPCDKICDTAIVIPNILCIQPTLAGEEPTAEQQKEKERMDTLLTPLGQGYFVIKPKDKWGDLFGKLMIESVNPTV